MRIFRRAFVAAAALSLTACGNSASVNQPLTPSVAASVPASATHRAGDPFGIAKYSHLYAADYINNKVVMYSYTVSGAVRRTVTKGIASPWGIAVDPNGDLYVANGAGSVTGYKPNAKSPFVTYTQGVMDPYGITFASDGTMYVANHQGQGTEVPGSVLVFPPKTTVPTATFTNAAFTNVNAIALDAKQDLFIAFATLVGGTFNTGLAEVAHGKTAVKILGYSYANSYPVGLAFDNDGNLAMGLIDVTAGTRVEVIPPGFAAASRSLGPYLYYGNAMTFNGKKNTVFISSQAGVIGYDYASGSTIFTIPGPTSSIVTGIAITPVVKKKR